MIFLSYHRRPYFSPIYRLFFTGSPDLYGPDHPKYVWQDVIIRMHDLRHTYATMLYDAGVDVKRAQYLLGHAEIETTMKIYVHLSKLREQRSNDAMQSYFENNECFLTVGKTVGKSETA